MDKILDRYFKQCEFRKTIKSCFNCGSEYLTIVDSDNFNVPQISMIKCNHCGASIIDNVIEVVRDKWNSYSRTINKVLYVKETKYGITLFPSRTKKYLKLPGDNLRTKQIKNSINKKQKD